MTRRRVVSAMSSGRRGRGRRAGGGDGRRVRICRGCHVEDALDDGGGDAFGEAAEQEQNDFLPVGVVEVGGDDLPDSVGAGASGGAKDVAGGEVFLEGDLRE